MRTHPVYENFSMLNSETTELMSRSGCNRAAKTRAGIHLKKKIPAEDFPYYASVQNYFDNNKLAITAVIIIKCFVYV